MRFRPLPRLPGLLLALLSSTAWAAAAEDSSLPKAQVRSIALAEKAGGVRVSISIPTTLTFDAPIDAQAVKLGEKAPVEILAVGGRSLTLRALEELSEAVTLRVPFLNESILTAPVFKLTTAADVVDAQVMVFRDASAPELMQARLAALEARCSACEAALTAQRDRGNAMTPSGWILSGQVSQSGLMVKQLRTPPGSATAGMAVVSVYRFKADAWVVLAVKVANLSGQPWRPGKAWLENPSTGRRVEARTVAMAPDVLPPNGTGRVAVELDWKKGESGPDGEDFRLVIQEAADSARPLTIPGVVLEDGTPAKEKSGP
ncbi:hypothetical protein COCOR_03375 [Corallococcus coralloides DSM 2259]|uniref:DUF2381 family protein n=1 Tax=Corallococcus coralloides (strain ATCC 25202 / DSM 2259 / NBRC 100086 / M2) TaxID=1144275 RepID=H8MJ60_CORCM|nr:DUF2381 family protein [Corallococcus coralloides]AFE05187.1 hypothetical protein COCOR_03375 [Corallococcus coralloides DSM 2259]